MKFSVIITRRPEIYCFYPLSHVRSTFSSENCDELLFHFTATCFCSKTGFCQYLLTLHDASNEYLWSCLAYAHSKVSIIRFCPIYMDLSVLDNIGLTLALLAFVIIQYMVLVTLTNLPSVLYSPSVTGT